MSKEKQFIEWLGRVTEFCLSRAGKCFGGWTPEKVFMYLGQNAAHGELFVVEDKEVKAIGIAGRTTKGIFIREVIGSRKECRILFQRVMEKWPDANRYFAYRCQDNTHKLFELSSMALRRFAT